MGSHYPFVMKYETESAASFWSSKLNPSLGETTLCRFQKELLTLMCEKFALHWYEENPLRGQAYREISCDFEDNQVDKILLNAAERAGFSFYHHFVPQRGLRMWVDPGEVEVSYTTAPHLTQILYQRGQSLSGSPPISPRSSSPVYYSAPSVNYYNSLSYTEPTLYYPETENDYVFLNEPEFDCSAQVNYGSYNYPVQHDVITTM